MCVEQGRRHEKDVPFELLADSITGDEQQFACGADRQIVFVLEGDVSI